jgi:hypothetical protein
MLGLWVAGLGALSGWFCGLSRRLPKGAPRIGIFLPQAGPWAADCSKIGTNLDFGIFRP